LEWCTVPRLASLGNRYGISFQTSGIKLFCAVIYIFSTPTVHAHILRASGRQDVLAEMHKCSELALTYTNSGDIYKLVGILRGCDVYWNKEK
jgi:hypothetical protein